MSEGSFEDVGADMTCGACEDDFHAGGEVGMLSVNYIIMPFTYETEITNSFVFWSCWRITLGTVPAIQYSREIPSGRLSSVILSKRACQVKYGSSHLCIGDRALVMLKIEFTEGPTVSDKMRPETTDYHPPPRLKSRQTLLLGATLGGSSVNFISNMTRGAVDFPPLCYTS